MLRLLAAPTFHAGAQYIPWLAGGVFFYGLSSLANTSLFLAGRMRYAAYLWLAGGIVSLAVNLLLVPLLGAYGAAMAQCVSYGVIAVAVGTVSQRILHLAIPWRRLAATLLLALASGMLMSPAWAAFPVPSLLCKLPVGLLVAALLLRMIAPDWFFRACARALGRT
jgi:O-antigen/teichoic acid export membrane protein